ncbi:MAG TPA: lactonase family protein [Bryobacteraceae bacterium]|nr:lactonase family protein [Bryobacteraceae bacterium]
MRFAEILSRRRWLTQAGALAAAPAGLAQRQTSRRLAYVGTYSALQGPEGSRGRGQGIYLFEMDPATGALTRRDLYPSDANPSWLALDPARTRLYSANETAFYGKEQSGSISAYAIDRPTGRLTLLNTESSRGAGPCYVSIHPSGKHALVANYHGGTIAVLPILSGGKLGPATDVKSVAGRPGPAQASSAPAGSFAISGHDRSHAHMIQSDPSGRFVLSTDLGLDRILIWRFDPQSGKLAPNDPPEVSLPPGDGPRHFAFHPNGRWFYSLQEEASTLAFFEYDSARGRLAAKQTISTLPKGYAGTNFTSEVLVSGDGRFVYVANRLHDTIAWFSIGPSGAPTLSGEEWTRGDYPRSFAIDPSGRFLYSCNQRSDAVTCFRINRQTGALTFTGRYTPVGTPAMILFLT